MYKLNNKIIRMDQDLVIGEGDDAVVVPVANLSNPSFRAQYGIVEAIEQTRPDDRWFYITERSDGLFEAVLKPRDFLEEKVWEFIKIKREAVRNGGVKVGDHWFHTDETSLTRYGYLKSFVKHFKTKDSTLKDFSGNVVMWKTMDGAQLEVTKELVESVYEAAGMFDMNVHAIAELHKAGMKQADLPFEYDFSKGWPEVYDRPLK